MRRFTLGMVAGLMPARSVGFAGDYWSDEAREIRQLRQQQLRLHTEDRLRENNRRSLEQLNRNPC